MSKELEKKKEDGLMVAEGMNVFSNAGFEGTTSESFMIPMMKIVQSLSPVRKKSDPSYNPEATEGQFYNGALNELYDEINLRVLSVEHQLVCWKPRAQGGGFMGTYHKTEEHKIVVARDGVVKYDADGNEVVDTLMFTCMDADNPTNLFFFPLSKSSLKHGKGWLSKTKAVKVNPKTGQLDPEGISGASSWVVVWNVKTTLQTNDQGEWYSIGKTPTAVRTFTEEELKEIQAALELVSKSKLDYGSMDSEESTEEVSY